MSTEAVVSAISESAATHAPLRVAGRSTWLDAGRPVRAVQVGGPLGAYVPESQFDTIVDYEAFADEVRRVVAHVSSQAAA